MKTISVPDKIYNELVKKMESERNKSKACAAYWEKHCSELDGALALLKVPDIPKQKKSTEPLRNMEEPTEPKPNVAKNIVTLPDYPCDGCQGTEYEFLRHQGNRYGDFNMYKCTGCGMRKNIKDKDGTTTKNTTAQSAQSDGANGTLMNNRTAQLRELAQSMGVK